MSQSEKDIPGNAYGSGLEFQRRAIRSHTVLMGFDALLGRMFDEGIAFRGMSIRPPRQSGGDWFITVRVTINGEPQVGFHAAPYFNELVVGVCERMNNRTMKWKDDAYA